MNTIDITQRLMASINGGKISTDVPYDFDYIMKLLPQLREDAIIITYNGSRTRAANSTISPDWLQSKTYTIDNSIQDTDLDYLLISNAMSIVRINDSVDGWVYQGMTDKAQTFLKANSINQISDWKRNNIIGNGKRIGCLRVGDEIRLYGNKSLSEFTEQCVYQNPDEMSGWNYQTSKYPVNEGLLVVMEELIQLKSRIWGNFIKDNVADATPTQQLPIVKNDLK